MSRWLTQVQPSEVAVAKNEEKRPFCDHCPLTSGMLAGEGQAAGVCMEMHATQYSSAFPNTLKRSEVATHVSVVLKIQGRNHKGTALGKSSAMSDARQIKCVQ